MQETFPPAPGAPDIISGEAELNLIVNSNRDFINQFAQIQNMDCSSDPQPLTLNRICVQVSIETTVLFRQGKILFFFGEIVYFMNYIAK